MFKIKVELNTAGVNELLRSSGMRAVIQNHAKSMAQRLGDGYGYRIWYGSKDGRVRAFVGTQSKKAFQENLEDNTIMKAVGEQND